MFLFILTGLVALLVYNPSVQTYAANTYLSSLSKKLKTKITVEGVEIDLFKKVTLTNIYVEDLHQDTLFYAKKINVGIEQFSLQQKLIKLEKATLTDAYFNLKKYKSDSTTSMQFIIDHFKSDKKTNSKWIFALDEVELKNVRFNYDDNHFEKIPFGVDYKHIGLTNVNGLINKIDLIPKGVDCTIKQLSFREQSGFVVNEFYAEANVSPSGIIAQNLKITTPNSKVDGNVTFLTDDYASLKNFNDEVKIKSFFTPTKASFKDIAYFAPALKGLEKWVNFQGEIKGKINNLKARKFSFETDDGTLFKGKTDISGLPNVDDMFMHVDIKELITSKEKVEEFPMFPFDSGKLVELPSNFRHLGAIRFKGSFTGFFHDFVAYGKVKTALGNISTDLALKINEGNSKYKGSIKTTHFNLGRFFEMSNDIGDITMDVSVDGKGFSKEDLDLDIDGKINQVVVKNYEYNNVDVKGNFKDKIFSGYMAVEDENISFDFDGKVDVSKKVPEYHFISNIKNAKLGKLNLVKSRKKLKTRFSTGIEVNLVGDHIDNLVGDILISNPKYNDKLDSLKVEKIAINSKIDNGNRTIKVKSDLLDANISGKYSFSEIGRYIDNFFVRYIPSQIGKKHEVTNLSHDLSFIVELHNTAILSKVLFRGIELSDNTYVEGKYDSKLHVLTIDGNAPNIDAYGVKINYISFNARAKESILDLVVDAERLAPTDSIYIDNFNIAGVLEKDTALTEISWDNDDEVQNHGNFIISSFFSGYQNVTGNFIDSYLAVNDTLWTIKSGGIIKVDTNLLDIKGLSVYSESQSILIDGKIDRNTNNQIDVLLKNFNLVAFKPLIPEKILVLEGIVDGVASISKKNEGLIFTSDLQFNKLRLNESLIGKGSLQALWNNASDALKLNGEFYREHIPSILFSGFYYPKNEEESLDLNFKLHRAELNMLANYIDEHVSNLTGTANADIFIKGNFDKPKLSGKVSLQKTEFKVNYLNTSYRTNLCEINIIPDMISFDNVVFLDEKNNVATANGTIYHEWFKELSIDVGLDATNFLALNTTELENELYYGKAFVTGFVNIGSYDKQMTIDAKIETDPNTVINIPLTDNQDIEENNFIEFVNFDDTSSLNVQIKEDLDLSYLEMNFDMEITPDAQVRLIFDDQIGDVMRSVGTGNITLNISNDGDLNMFGNYVVIDGDYLFTLQNVINKRFDLEEGGTITWNGSPYDAEIDLTAVYRLRARLYDLLVAIDTSDVYKKRIPIDLKLKMKNAMMNPDISFDVGLPTADEDTKNKVRSVLYVSGKEENVQELNKQVFSLLVLNSFVAPQGAEASYGHANVGATTSSELLSNQLSNMLSRISNDFDVGINYHPGDELSSQELELALSTQLFNDRLILDGNFGVADRNNVSSEAQNTNNLIGDISLEYKITKDGKLRAKAFNNSNQYSFQNVNSPYTQGLGLSYKEEYDTGKEFWRKLFNRFRSKAKKKGGK